MEEKQIENKHYYKVNHRYKDKMILPLIAVSNNIDFITTDNDRYVVTADSVKCKVSFCCIRTLFQVEKDIENNKISFFYNKKDDTNNNID